MTMTTKALLAALTLTALIPLATAMPRDPAPRPSDHFCRDVQLGDGRTVPVCRCYSAIDCRRVVPACTPLILASDRDAEKKGRCASSAPRKG